MGRHAYLIMAHNQFELLGLQLDCLDHERNDFYIHVDKKSDCDFFAIKSHVRKGRCYFTDRVNVKWGGYSQIRAELVLLEEATSNEKYDYYHLLTGIDLPLKPQQEILDYFDSFDGEEFISMSNEKTADDKMWDRVRYYYPFQDLLNSRKNIVSKILRKICICIQKFFRIDRSRCLDEIRAGSAYFDITDEFARFILQNKQWIVEHFKKSLCADELFMQTLFCNKGNLDFKIHKEKNRTHEYIQDIYLDVKRAIDWKRGNPYVYQIDDFEMLMGSGCLFARKFDYKLYPEIVEKIYSTIMEANK